MIKKLPFKIITVCVLFFAWSQTFGQGVWKQTGSNINGSHAGNNFGTTIHFAAGGNTFAAASVNDSTSGSLRGQVRVFTRSGNSWVQKGANLTGVANGDFFGRSVALDSVGNTIAIGGPYNDAGLGSMSTAGHVKVYSWSGSAWTQKGSTLLADSAGENFGYSVSISYDGNTLAIGIPFGRDTLDVYRGRVKIYRWNGTAWNQLGKSLLGLNKNDVFGNAVSLDRTGNTVAIGAPFHSAGGPEAGRVSVYNWNNTDTSWHQLGSGIDGDTSDYSGTALSLSADGKRLAIGSPQDIIFGGYGVARMYEWNNTAWVQMGSSIFSPYFADQFGNAISISGDGSMVAVGASVNVTGSEAGRTQVYKWTGSAWTLAGDTIKGVTSGDGAGTAVSLSYNGKLLATGAPMAGGNGANSGITTVMSYCIHNSSTVNITSCSGNYVSPSGKYTWTTNGVYNDTIPNNGGCDSVITINLTIGTKPTVNLGTDISQCLGAGAVTLDAANTGATFLWSTTDTTKTISVNTTGTYFVKVTNNGCSAYDTIVVTYVTFDKTVTQINNIITVAEAESGASYQWLNCTNGKQPVIGANTKSVTLPDCVKGTYTYAVEISKNGCKDTSSCGVFRTFPYRPKGEPVNGANANETFGYSVASSADGNTVVVGAINSSDTGYAAVYTWNGSAWVQKGSNIIGEYRTDKFGRAVAMDAAGNTIAVGAPENSEDEVQSGHVRIFSWNGTAWVQKGTDINGNSTFDFLGYAVSMSGDGNTVVIGAPSDATGLSSTNHKGFVSVYKWDGSAWVKKGSSISGVESIERLGYSVSLTADGNTFAASGYGIVKIYKWSGSVWEQKGSSILRQQNGSESFGSSISLSKDGNTIAIGVPGKNQNKGQVQIFGWNGSAWLRKGSDINGDASTSYLGYSLSLSANGNTLAVGAPNSNINGLASGLVRLYGWSGTAWIQKGADCVGDTLKSRFGWSLSLADNGDWVVVGALGHNQNTGQVRVVKECSFLVGIKENPRAGVKKENTLLIYPNPSTGLFTLKSNGPERLSAVEVFNTMGQLVYSNTFTGNTTETALVLNTEPNGIYFVKVTTTAGSQTLRLMVQH